MSGILLRKTSKKFKKGGNGTKYKMQTLGKAVGASCTPQNATGVNSPEMHPSPAMHLNSPANTSPAMHSFL
jgi:hypothetical protein